MPMRSYAALAWRGFLYAVFMAGLGIFVELIADFMSDPHLPFNSVLALFVFSVGIGSVPVLPSPSRFSSGPLGLGGRIFLGIEFTVFLATAMVFSEKYKIQEQFDASDFSTLVGNSVFLSINLYMVILTITLISNFTKLKQEIMNARSSVS